MKSKQSNVTSPLSLIVEKVSLLSETYPKIDLLACIHCIYTEILTKWNCMTRVALTTYHNQTITEENVRNTP